MKREDGLEPEVVQASDRIINSITVGGPKDIYQLSKEVGDISTTERALRFLVEKELIEDRNSITPNFTGDPFSTIYGLKRGAAPGSRLKSW